MATVEEYLRLPHGMFDREEEWVNRAREILSQHERVGKSIGCEVKKYTPLGFSETYQRGTNAANDKVYKFNSKSGRSLMLSSDSTPSIFREYVASGMTRGRRVSFVAPLFRYRNSHTRHFTQIGYAIINEPKSKGDIDINLIELAKSMVNLCNSVGIKIKIYINDYQALKNMLSSDISQDEMPEVLHKLQFANTEERIDFFKQNITSEESCRQLIDLFQKAPQVVSGNSKSNELNLPEEYMGIYRLAEGLRTVANVEVIFDPANLHSVETIENYALRFITVDGVQLGDGGEYTGYARRFDEKIKSFWSVASGVEALERNSPFVLPKEVANKVALYNIDASAMFVLRTIQDLEKRGFIVVYQGDNVKIGKNIKKLSSDFTHVVILGKSEEEGNEIQIKDLSTRKACGITEFEEIGRRKESTDAIKLIIDILKDYIMTNNFRREDLINLIAAHSDNESGFSLTAEDIESLILEVGKACKENSLIADVAQNHNLTVEKG